MELIGLYLIACVLLVAAGVAKSIRPTDTARALTAIVPMPLGRMRALVRIGSLAEAALGALALALPRPGPAGLVAASYAAFAVVVLVARSRGGAIASCGCFGTPDTPATLLHVVVDLVLAGAAVAVAAAAAASGAASTAAADRSAGTIASILSRQPLHGVPLILVSALGAWLTYLAISVMAELQGARRLTAVTFRSGS